MSLDLDRSKWQRVKFGDVVKNVNENSKDPSAVGIDRVIGLEHLDSGELKIERWGEVTPETTFTRRVRPGQTLFGKRRAYQRKTAYAEFDAVCSGDILVFESADPTRLLPELLPFIAMTDGFYDKALETSAGSLSPRTRWSDLAKYEFDLPPLDQQRRIADLLWGVENHGRTTSCRDQRLRDAWCAWIDHGLRAGAKSLADFGTVKVGFPFKSADFGSSGTRLLRGINIGVGVTRWERGDTALLPGVRDSVHASFELAVGDFVIPMDRPFTAKGDLRWAQLAESDLPSLLVQRVARIRPKSQEAAQAIKLLLNSRRVLRGLGSSLTGSFAPHLAHGDFSRGSFEFVDLEQILADAGRWHDALRRSKAEFIVTETLRPSLVDRLLGRSE